MNQTRTILTVGLAVVVGLGTLQARESNVRSSSKGQSNKVGNRAAACTPSAHRANLQFNNVRALIETGGNMWQNRDNPGGPAYEVPKTPDNTGPKAIFAGSLWMGGTSPDNQLKLAAVRFRQVGNDYWPGPLTTDGAATIDGQVCQEYDNTWGALRVDAELHQAYYLCQDDPDCDVAAEFPNYTIPDYFFDWPAHGDVSLGQDFNLAPFTDYDLSGFYDPTDGDYPGFDLNGVIDCAAKGREDAIPLFGDSTIWWVFNDKGNAHTESGGQPIGMEIRAQAFAFATNDQVNNMTFYNYTLINQGTQTLLNTYFGQWVDSDLGNFQDDFVGCDVRRGLGYSYNGDNNDESTQNPGYGVQPPAVGVDFFEGPYQDSDNMDNPLTSNIQDAIDSLGIPYRGIGIGYGDNVIDNERFGMRAFLYHNNNGSVTGDPGQAIQYYNYLRGIWRDGSQNCFGANGHPQGGCDVTIPASYMFPGDSDPLYWGTAGVPTNFEWTEEQSNNAPDDRRFIQSAGPFTLAPGDYNNITVGVVWARATGGGPFESVNEVRVADDKAQSLFDNCFRILNGPDAPILSIQEMDEELVIYLDNPQAGNNYLETYTEFDPTIPEFVVNSTTGDTTFYDQFYRFQGYQIYQLADETVSVSEIDDVDRARLIYQGDIRDNVGQMVNYINNPAIGLPVPTEMVDGANEGVRHSIRVTEDQFAQGGNTGLVNFKTYYFLAVAYGSNNYANYNPVQATGQAFPYLRGRKSALGPIDPISGIPHNPAPEAGGTIQGVEYGDSFEITRVEGVGNGGLEISIKDEDLYSIGRNAPYFLPELTYEAGLGPINVTVVDPLLVPAADFELRIIPDPQNPLNMNLATWEMTNLSTGDTAFSERSIDIANDQLLIKNPAWGISVNIENYQSDVANFSDPVAQGAFEIEDQSKLWYTGIPDVDGEIMLNWIRSGTNYPDPVSPSPRPSTPWDDYTGADDEEIFEGYAGGTWAPWTLVGDTGNQPGAVDVNSTHGDVALEDVPSIEVVMTADKDLWTRCVVLEIAEFGSEYPGDNKLEVRSDQSVDKNGNPDGTGTGMGWFPGFAVNLETGERMNMAFGEDSFWGGPTGRDMIWNPSDTLFTGSLGQPIFGGGHWIYVFNNTQRSVGLSNRMPMYDEGAAIRDALVNGSLGDRLRVFGSVAWVGSALKISGSDLLATEVKIRLNTSEPYGQLKREPFAGYPVDIAIANEDQNGGFPLYRFTTGSRAVVTDNLETAKSACDLIDVVPNPYYAWSAYESDRLDNRVKITNLPVQCTVSIFNVSGSLVRQYRKDNDLTYLDWDLKNQNNVPIAGGLYIIHIESPNTCERVVKWFGALRPTDLQNF